MSFGRPASSGAGSSDAGFRSGIPAARYHHRPSSARPASRGSARSSSSQGSDNTKWEMSLEEFKRQVQNQFTVVLSWDEVRALQKLYGEPDSGTIDFMKFAVALGKSPGHGPDKTRRAYNFLPKHTVEYDLKAIERKIIHKLEDRCEVAGNYQYQWARRMLCDAGSTMAGGLDKDQFKLRLSGLLGVELSDGEMGVLFEKYADPVTGRTHMQSFATRLLAPDQRGGWFFLDNQMKEPVVTNRISPSARYHKRHGVETYRPMDNVFPTCLRGFKWNMEKLAAKLKAKMHEHAQGIAGYQFLAGCNIFRREVPHRKGDRISAADFRRVVEYKFGMKLDPDEVSELLHFLVPGTGESIEIAEMVRVLVPNDYTDSWFSTRESTDMFGFTKAAPDKVVLQAKKMSVSGSWNLSLIEEKIREKIHERVGGTGVFEVQAAYTLFLDGRNTGLTKKGFKTQMHDKFAVVLSDKDVNDVFAKYDPKGTGSLDVHNFVVRLISPIAEPEPWFRDRATYEFHVLNRAPMKKDPMKADCWKRAKWNFRQFETTLADKLVAKSNQDGGSFAFKSAVNLLRSANPDHLDSSNMDREALKFIVFRRFDIVMDDHLLDEVFARFDPEGTGKMPVHRLVQHLLPDSHDGSHHLVPKTKEQGNATKTLLGKIFGMTGKRREMINLNGSGVEDPQAQSLLERMAAGKKEDGQTIEDTLARRARAAVASASAAKVAAAEAARNGPRAQAASVMAAAAARRRKASPLAFSGDIAVDATGSIHAPAPQASPSTRGVWSSPRKGICDIGEEAGGQVDVSDSHRAPHGGSASVRNEEAGRRGVVAGDCLQPSACVDVGRPVEPVQSSSDVLRERERTLDDRERTLCAREHAINRRALTSTVTPGGAEMLHVGTNEALGANGTTAKRRPQSARDRSSSKDEEGREASMIARCKALGLARRKAAMVAALAAAQQRKTRTNGSDTQTSRQQLAPGCPKREESVILENSEGNTSTIDASTRSKEQLGAKEVVSDPRNRGTRGYGGHSSAVSDDVDETALIQSSGAVAARAPSRPQSASVPRHSGVCPRPRPRSAAMSPRLCVGSKVDGHGGGQLALGGRKEDDKTFTAVMPSPSGFGRHQHLGSSAASHNSRRPASASVARRESGSSGSGGNGYRKRLDSVYAMQMRAMHRLQRRNTSKTKHPPERPASGGTQGLGVGQFRSRYSGFDRFVLVRGLEKPATSRFGGGVAFYG